MSSKGAPADLDLLDGEEVIWVIRPVAKGFLNEFVGLLILIGATAVLYSMNPFGDESLSLMITGFGVLVGALLILIPLCNWIGHSYIITDRRVIGRFDFIVHRESTIYFEKVQNVRVIQGIFDNIVDTGMVTMETAAGAMMPEETLRWISSPRALRGKIMNIIEKERGGRGGLGEPSGNSSSANASNAILTDILSELKGIREDLGKK